MRSTDAIAPSASGGPDEARPAPCLVGGAPCLDFVNTIEGSRDWLASYSSLVEWCRHAAGLDQNTARALLAEADRHPRRAAEAARRARHLRDALSRILEALARRAAPARSDLDVLNGEVSAALGRLRVAGVDPELSLRFKDDPAALDRVLWPVARSAAELLTSDRCFRIKVCDGDGCDWFFLDTSRNGQRRWCAMRACGNRAKARRYYRRRKARRRGASRSRESRGKR